MLSRTELYDNTDGDRVFYIFYAVVEVPSNILLKKIGPKYYLPALVISFGLVTTCTSVVNHFGELVTVRIFLGIAEGGLMVNIQC